MGIDHPHFWKWIDEFKPDVILFQDQNIYGKTQMQEESSRLKKMGIKLINYPDWIQRGDIEKYHGLYDIPVSAYHVPSSSCDISMWMSPDSNPTSTFSSTIFAASNCPQA